MKPGRQDASAGVPRGPGLKSVLRLLYRELSAGVESDTKPAPCSNSSGDNPDHRCFLQLLLDAGERIGTSAMLS